MYVHRAAECWSLHRLSVRLSGTEIILYSVVFFFFLECPAVKEPRCIVCIAELF